MITILLLALLECSNMTVINEHGDWTPKDQLNFEFAQKECLRRYPDSPCLRVFQKTEEGYYRTQCWRKRNYEY